MTPKYASFRPLIALVWRSKYIASKINFNQSSLAFPKPPPARHDKYAIYAANHLKPWETVFHAL